MEYKNKEIQYKVCSVKENYGYFPLIVSAFLGLVKSRNLIYLKY